MAENNLQGPRYSPNLLYNGDGSKGLDGWEGGDVRDGHFCVAPGTSMRQEVSAGGTHPPDIRVSGYFLAPAAIHLLDAEIKAYVKITNKYADGTFDTVVIPMKGVEVDGD